MTKKDQELTEREIMQIELEELAEKNCLIRVVAGSHAYGTNIEGSDWDERGIFTDIMQRITLPFEKIEQVQFSEDDKVYFELSKFMPLLLSQNPNVIELLWTEESDVLYKNEMGQLLIDNRHEFLSVKVKDSYVGYATSQLNRIKGHNKWINNPQPEREPLQSDFMSVVWNYSNNQAYNKKVPTDGYIALSIGDNNYSLWNVNNFNINKKSWISNSGVPNPINKEEFVKINKDNLSPDLIVKVNKSLYESHHTNWKMYWKWKNNRNEKRAILEEQYGYDVKHAMHLIRLLRSGLDILEHGIVPVKRNDAQYLLDIRKGKYTYDEIIQESERLKDKISIVCEKTKLPNEANTELAKEIMLEIYKNQWKLENKNISNKKFTLK